MNNETFEAYRALIDIEHIMYVAELLVKERLTLSSNMISDLNRVGGLGKCIEAYTRMTGDKKMIEEISKIQRAIFSQISGWYDIPDGTTVSLMECAKSLYNVAQMTNQDSDNTTGSDGGATLPAGSDGGATLPKELNTEEAIKLLQKAVKIGLCDERYKWLKSKSLLAYFADKASEYLGLSKGKYYDNEIEDDSDKTFWKPFETLFDRKNLSQAKRDYKRKGLPRDYKVVENLFK